MVLIQLRNYLQKTKSANLLLISKFVNAEPEAVRSMLEFWIQKGCVRKCQKSPSCASACGKCGTLVTERYEWVGV